MLIFFSVLELHAVVNLRIAAVGGDDYVCRQDARRFRERIAVDIFAIFTAFEFEFVARP